MEQHFKKPAGCRRSQGGAQQNSFLLIPIFILIVVISCAQPASCEDESDEDLGFNTNSGSKKLGSIAGKAFHHREWDASFICNNLPVSYCRASTGTDLNAFQTRFEKALKIAEQKKDNRKGYVLLLESGASFYQKRNEHFLSYDLLRRLVAFQNEIAPMSEDLAEAQIACARAARLVRKFPEAESCLNSALAYYRNSNGLSPRLPEINAELFWLYTDMGKVSKVAALVRSFSIAKENGGHDPSRENQASITGISFNAWPEIISCLDSVSTAQTLQDVRQEAEKVALGRLKEEQKKVKEELEKERAEQKEKEKQGQNEKSVSTDSEKEAKAEKEKLEKIAKEKAEQ